jgi:hypothetical protein
MDISEKNSDKSIPIKTCNGNKFHGLIVKKNLQLSRYTEGKNIKKLLIIYITGPRVWS